MKKKKINKGEKYLIDRLMIDRKMIIPIDRQIILRNKYSNLEYMEKTRDIWCIGKKILPIN